MPKKINILYDAKIIHYFASQPGEKAFIPANKSFLQAIKETGVIDQRIKDMLDNPKSFFAPNTRLMLVDRSLRGFYDSALCGAAKRIYFTKFGAAIEGVFFGIRKYIFTPLRRKLSRRI